MTFPVIDLPALAQLAGVNLPEALSALRALYDDLDARNAKNSAGLDLPCHQGCDACCHESVFLTPLEFFCAWGWAQDNLDAATRDEIVARGLQLYAEHRHLIDQFDAPPAPGDKDHFAVAKQLRFTCPILGPDGGCRVYPARELYARMFGCSFNEEGGVYGCDLVGNHLAGKTVTLLRVRPQALRLQELPLTGKRQVYPWYFQQLYGEAQST